MTAICASEEAGADKEGRYAASVINGILFIVFGLIASLAMAFVSALPSALTSIIAGLAMINVLYSSFKDAFSTNKFKYGSFFSLVIAMSNITVFKISAPLLALIGGVIISLLVENKDFNHKTVKA
jgi:benzoate membrane transport protein